MLPGLLPLTLRTLVKQRRYAAINLVGLALGLTVFLFASLVVRYERTHDSQFADHDRIYLIGSRFTPDANEPISEYPDIRTAYAPLFRQHIDGLEAVARAVHRRPIVTVGDRHRYQSLRFVDPAFTRIFRFDYLAGSETALDSPDGLILTRSTALELFGRSDVLNEPVQLSHSETLRVTGVIEDVPVNTHFNSDLRDHYELTALASLSALHRLSGFPLDGRWTDEFENNATYIKVSPGLDRAGLNDRINAVFQAETPASEKAVVQGLNAHPLIDAHNQVWAVMGFPVLETVQLMGLLVLLVACVNYANLATALSLGRRREVGLRKVLGARRDQLLVQFLGESLVMVTLAMLVAMAAVEALIPVFNHWTGKALALHYGTLLAWGLATTVVVTLLAGAYPAWVISRPHPIDALGYAPETGGRSQGFRAVLVGLQFTVALFMLAMVLIIMAQNQTILSQSRAFPMASVWVLDQIEHPSVRNRREALRDALNRIDGVREVSFSNGYPFNPVRLNETGRQRQAFSSASGAEHAFTLDMIAVDEHFRATYDIPLLAGRPLADARAPGDPIEVIVNHQTLLQLGLNDAEAALGYRFATRQPDSERTEPAVIVGVMPDRQFNGSYSDRSALAFYRGRDPFYYASVRLDADAPDSQVTAIERAWNDTVTGIPIRHRQLADYFNAFYKIPRGIQRVLSGFSIVALSLALTGLFGLVALMAQRRTREIGIRKAMGASTGQIVQLMLWQFSRPILASILIAAPLAYWASTLYLDFFPEPIDSVLPFIALACLIVMASAWATIAVYTLSLARLTPIHALRYE